MKQFKYMTGVTASLLISIMAGVAYATVDTTDMDNSGEWLTCEKPLIKMDRACGNFGYFYAQKNGFTDKATEDGVQSQLMEDVMTVFSGSQQVEDVEGVWSMPDGTHEVMIGASRLKNYDNCELRENTSDNVQVLYCD